MKLLRKPGQIEVKPGEQIGKLSMRHEGAFWNAYYAEKDKEPVFLGGVAVLFTESSRRRQRQFMELMQDCLADLVRAKYGVVIEFDQPQVLGKPDEFRGGS